MTRSSVPSEFRTDPGPKASERSVKYARDLLRQKDLFKNSQWFDRVNAMDSEEYAAYLDQISDDMENWDQPKVSKTIKWLLKLPNKPVERATTVRDIASEMNPFKNSLPTPDQLPAGRYAVEVAGELRFYRLWRGTRNPNYVSLYVQHGPDESKVEWKATPSILRKIVEAGPFEAAVRYGREIGACAKCGTRLTNTLSRELGIGPVCGGRYFENTPDAWKAMKKEARAAIVARGEDPDSELD